MISVIVPVYNCEKYIERCVNSVLAQSYTDFELILVDDGSTDDTGILCEKFNLLDARIHVYHKTNGGVSSARNEGLNFATGEYVAFIDADDWVGKGYLETLVKPTNDVNTIDIVVMPWKTDEEFENSIIVPRYKEEACSLKKKLACLQLLSPNAWRGWSVHSKLYRKHLFQNLRFFSELRYGEDLIMNLELFYRANHFYYVPQTSYHYCRVNDFSLTQKIDVDAWATFLQVMINYMSTRNAIISIAQGMFSEFCRVIARFYMGWICQLVLSGVNDKKEFSKLTDIMDAHSKQIFTQLPPTILGSLQAQFYAKPSKVYDNYVNMMHILQSRDDKSALYIYGAGKKAKRVSDFFARKNILFNAFIVSDGQKISASPDMKHPVIYFSDYLSAQNPVDTIIFLALKDEFAEEVLPNLEKYQFNNIFCL